MKKNNPLIIFLFLFLFLLPGSASLQDQRISNAHQLLQDNKYLEARLVYLELIGEGYSGISLFYNLGIANYEIDEIPSAILYFEKALKLDPGNEAIQHNLDLANKKIDQDFIKMEDMFLKVWWNSVAKSLSSTAWAVIFILCLLLLLISFYLYQFNTQAELKKWSGRIFYPGIVLVLIIFLLGWESFKQSKDQSAAILMEVNDMYSGPDLRSEKMYELKAGSRIVILDRIEGWVKIILINKESGWMEDKNFEAI